MPNGRRAADRTGGLAIRRAARTDADVLGPLAEAAARATYAPIAQPAVYEAFIAQSCTRDALASAIARATDDPQSYFVVAVEGSSVVGYLDFGRDEDGAMELRRLYAAVGSTSRGIGAALLGWLERQLPVGTEYRAIVHARNERALSFWLRHGFVIEGELDTREHLAAQRGLTFGEPAEPEPSLVLSRVVG
jgi:ribosomal protein S18 acetylase RimI-like enzyme